MDTTCTLVLLSSEHTFINLTRPTAQVNPYRYDSRVHTTKNNLSYSHNTLKTLRTSFCEGVITNAPQCCLKGTSI